MSKPKTILLYGRSNAGKSTQVGVLAEYVYKTSGKKTRLYSIDKGGYAPIQPYIDLGIIEVVDYQSTVPWIFLNKAVRGFVRDNDNKWIPGTNDVVDEQIGLYAFESLTAFGDALMTSMAEMSAKGINIGGGANVSFNVTDDGESLKVAGSNVAHYNVAQTRIMQEVWESFKLDSDYVLWTASVQKDTDDLSSSTKVLGPAVVGKALTTECPRWFGQSFRIDALPGAPGKPERHILYLGNNIDVAAGNAVGLGNTRSPLDGGAIPSTIEPANIVQALEVIDKGYSKAIDIIKKRVGK